MSAVGTTHMIWAEPTALENDFFDHARLKPGATILAEATPLFAGC